MRSAEGWTSAALSVVGNPTNATTTVADIAAGADHQVLRRSGTGLGFGAVNLASANAVTGVLPVANVGTGGVQQLDLVAGGSGTADDYAVADSEAISVSSVGAVTWTGATPTVGRVFLVYARTGTGTITVAHNHANSTAGNRFATATGADVTFAAGDWALMWKDDVPATDVVRFKKL